MKMKSLAFRMNSGDKKGSEKIEVIYVALENALTGESQQIEDIIREYLPKIRKPTISKSASVTNGMVEENRDIYYNWSPFFGGAYSVHIGISRLKSDSNREIEVTMSLPKRKSYSVVRDIVKTFEPEMDDKVKGSYKMLEDIFSRDPLAS
jgi:hypothetical protein